MANPDLHISGVGGGGGHPHSEIRGAWSPKNIFFRPFRPHFGQSIRGGSVPPPGAPPLDPPLYYIAASPQASSTLIFGVPVVSWVSCRYLDVIIWIDVCQDDSQQVWPEVSS